MSDVDKRRHATNVARQLFEKDPDWATFFREVLGVGGVVRQMYPTSEALIEFERTPEYAEIQAMLKKLRDGNKGKSIETEPTRVITVRLPKALQESLNLEADEYHTSVNQLCISKLLQLIDDDLVPAAIRTSPSITLLFDLKDFGPTDVADVLTFLSDLYRSVGGDGLVIDGAALLESALLPQPVGG